MAKYQLEVSGKKYEVEAESPDSLPEIADTIAQQNPSSSKNLAQKIGQNALNAGRAVYTEGVSPILSGINNVAFGLPKAAIGAVGGRPAIDAVFPEQTTLDGKALRLGAEARGYVQGLAGKVGMAVANKVMPQMAKSTLGLSSPVGSIAALNAAKLANNAGRAAITGGVAGTAQLMPNAQGQVDPMQQLIQGGIGAIGGAALAAGGAAVRPVQKAWTNLVNTADSPILTRIADAGKTVNKRFGDITAKATKVVQDANTKFQSTISQANQMGRGLAKDFSDTVAQASIHYDNLANATRKEVQNLSNAGVEVMQESVPKYFREASKEYGRRFDELVGTINESGGITRAEANAVLQNTLEEANAINITEGNSLGLVKKYLTKYGIDEVEKAPSIGSLMGESGGVSATSNADELIDIAQFVKDVRNIKGAISGGAKAGTSPLSHEDVVASMVKNQLGDLMASKSQGFAELQAAYRPVMQAKKEAYRLFQPNKEYGGKPGFGLFARVGKGSATDNELRLLDHLEQGSDFAKGVGDVTRELRQLPKQLEDAAGTLRQVREGARQKSVNGNVDVTNMKANAATERDKTKDLIAQAKEKERVSKSNYLDELNTRRLKVLQIKENDRKSQALIRAAALSAGGIASVATGVNLYNGLTKRD